MRGSVFFARTSCASAPRSSSGAWASRWRPSSGVRRAPASTLRSIVLHMRGSSGHNVRGGRAPRIEDTTPGSGGRAAALEYHAFIMTGTFLSDLDVHLLREGTHLRAWEKLGAHPMERDGVRGTQFAVWAPNAREVSVIGDFN